MVRLSKKMREYNSLFNIIKNKLNFTKLFRHPGSLQIEFYLRDNKSALDNRGNLLSEWTKMRNRWGSR